MSPIVKWLALAVVAYVLWSLTRGGGRINMPTGTPQPTTGPDGKVRPAPLVDPAKLPPPVASVDVAYDVPNGDTLAIDPLTRDVNGVSGVAIRSDIMIPAGRVREFADITQDDWDHFFGLLAMTLTRQDGRSQRWNQFNANMADQQTGQTVDSVVGGIVSAIAGAVGGPVVSILLKYAQNVQVQQLANAIATEKATADFVDKLRINANPAKLPPSALILLQGNDVSFRKVQQFNLRDASGAPAVPTNHALAQSLNMPPDVEAAIGIIGPYDAEGQAGNTYDGYPNSLFMLTDVGLFLPWVSSQLIGADYHATCNLRARVMRCFDIFQAMVFRLSVADSASLRRYCYRNKVYGDLVGCWLPPTEEDAQYVDAAGVAYTFDGRPIPSIVGKSNVAGGLVVEPVNVPGIVPTGSAASSGPGEQFNANPAPPLGAVAPAASVGLIVPSGDAQTIAAASRAGHRAM